MCDNHYNFCWQNNFYHQYMHQHAAMMHWIQSLHSNVNVQGTYDINQTSQGCFHSPKTVRCDNTNPRECNSYHESTSSSYESSGTSTNTESSIESHVNDEEEESEYEFELNVDAILAMRKAKEELKKDESSDSSSIVMIDKPEEFEFVELGSKQDVESRRSIMFDGTRDRNAELQHEKKLKEHLYGEKFNTIAGLETAMSLTYERLCDIHQPSFWPVYPLRLSSSAK